MRTVKNKVLLKYLHMKTCMLVMLENSTLLYCHPMSPSISFPVTLLVPFFCCIFSSPLIPTISSLFLLPVICFPFLLLFYLSLSPSFLLTLSASLLFPPVFLPHSLVSTPSVIYFSAFLSPITLLLPPHFIIPSLYWCSCRNETWLWLICWQSLRGPLVVVPLHRGHMWLIEPGENFVRLAIMTGSLAW